MPNLKNKYSLKIKILGMMFAISIIALCFSAIHYLNELRILSEKYYRIRLILEKEAYTHSRLSYFYKEQIMTYNFKPFESDYPLCAFWTSDENEIDYIRKNSKIIIREQDLQEDSTVDLNDTSYEQREKIADHYSRRELKRSNSFERAAVIYDNLFRHPWQSEDPHDVFKNQ